MSEPTTAGGLPQRHRRHGDEGLDNPAGRPEPAGGQIAFELPPWDLVPPTEPLRRHPGAGRP